MYPIKTDLLQFETQLSEKEVEDFLKNQINNKSNFQTTNNFEFYGQVNTNCAKFELGLSPIRNSFTPIIILNWHPIESGSMIESHLRLDNRISITCMILPLLGLSSLIEYKILTPLVAIIIVVTIFLFGIIRIFYELSKSDSLEKLKNLLKQMDKIAKQKLTQKK